MKKKVIVTGGSGLLGQYLNINVSEKFELLTIYNINKGNCFQFNSVKSDLRNVNELNKLFESFRPDIVVHSAAITNPMPKPDQNSKLYYDINVNVTKTLAELCSKFKAKLIYISTDLVYAGYRGSMLKENAKLIPASLYAETKLMGEVKVMELVENYLILRIALLYGFGLYHSRCHFHEMFNSLKDNKPVKLFTDQYRTPISLQEAAEIIAQLAAKDNLSGILNLGGKERISRYHLGEILCDAAGFDKSLLTKITMDQIPGLPKVEDVSLNTEKLQSLGIKQKSIEESIIEMLKEQL
jgi:dTDP-4-dehydrorhamnose reductase